MSLVKKSHLDLRCRRRITLGQGKYLVALLKQSGSGRHANRLLEKLSVAVKLADHKCVFVVDAFSKSMRKMERQTWGKAKKATKRCKYCHRHEGWKRIVRDVPPEFEQNWKCGSGKAGAAQ